eukprot:GHVU01015289.1.p1 GENE.GHVU01015289.1~~GHVU01015289.1.p1  ORF type:complete len:113 (-),score=17.03 GHVU01015289.1:22-360(-)
MKLDTPHLYKKAWSDTIKKHLDEQLIFESDFSLCLVRNEYIKQQEAFFKKNNRRRTWAESDLSLYARTDRDGKKNWHLLSNDDLSSIDMTPEDYKAETTEFLVTSSEGTWSG